MTWVIGARSHHSERGAHFRAAQTMQAVMNAKKGIAMAVTTACATIVRMFSFQVAGSSRLTGPP